MRFQQRNIEGSVVIIYSFLAAKLFHVKGCEHVIDDGIYWETFAWS